MLRDVLLFAAGTLLGVIGTIFALAMCQAAKSGDRAPDQEHENEKEENA